MSIPTKLSALALGLGLAWAQPVARRLKPPTGRLEIRQTLGGADRCLAHRGGTGRPGQSPAHRPRPGQRDDGSRPDRSCAGQGDRDGRRAAQAPRRAVQKGEVVADLESREVADAKSEFLTAGPISNCKTPCSSASRPCSRRRYPPSSNSCGRERLFGVEAAARSGAPEALGARCRRGRDRQPAETDLATCATTSCARRSPDLWSSAGSTSAPGRRRPPENDSTPSPTSLPSGSNCRLHHGPLRPGGGRRHRDRGPRARRGQGQGRVRQPDPQQGDAPPGSSPPSTKAMAVSGRARS